MKVVTVALLGKPLSTLECRQTTIEFNIYKGAQFFTHNTACMDRVHSRKNTEMYNFRPIKAQKHRIAIFEDIEY